MPTLEWLKKEFAYGYDSGNILGLIPNRTRRKEERVIGGSYKKIFKRAVLPYIHENARVLEIGPGKGSWTRAILKYITQGEVMTIDFVNTDQWLKPENYKGRLKSIQIEGYDYSGLKDNYFDFIWSFGVLCHNNQEAIGRILSKLLVKARPGAMTAHQYGDWDKLEKLNWGKGCPPKEFREKCDNEIWWPRNNPHDMARIALDAGWQVISPDLDLVKRDSIILLRKTV